jgi:hypothetical protein
MYKNIKNDMQDINHLKKNIETSNKLQKSETIDRYGYTYFKPNLKNKQENINYDIESEIQGLMREYKTHQKYSELVKSQKDNLETKKLKTVLDNLNNKDKIKQETEETNCEDCIKLFSKEIQKSYNLKNFKKNTKEIIENIENYYKLLQKTYFFDYMIEPTLENKKKISMLNQCYTDLIKGKCYQNNLKFSSKIYDKINDPLIIYENNLEKLNLLLNI